MPKLYGSVSGQTKEIKKLYGPVNTTIVTGVTGTIRTGSSGIAAGLTFDGEVFFDYVDGVIDLTKTPSYLLMHSGHGGDSLTLTLYYTDNTSYAFEGGSYISNVGLYGLTWTDPAAPEYTGDDYIDLTATTATGSIAKEIQKLYGPVDGIVGIAGTIRSGGIENVTGYSGKTFYSVLKSEQPTLAGRINEMDYIKAYVSYTSIYSAYCTISLYMTDSTFVTLQSTTSSGGTIDVYNALSKWGLQHSAVATGADYVDITGPINGKVTKLIYQA